MKRILSFVLLIILLISCQSKKEKIELNLKKGETYTQKITTIHSSTMTIDGIKAIIKTSLVCKLKYRVIIVHDSTYDLEVKYESLSMIDSTPLGVIEINSEKFDESSIHSKVIHKVLKAITGKPFFVSITKAGKIINEVENIEMIISNALDELTDSIDIEKQDLWNLTMPVYGEEAIKGRLELCYSIFPDFPVSKGDMWSINSIMRLGMPTNMESTYELKDVNDSYYFLSGIYNIDSPDIDSYLLSKGLAANQDVSNSMTSKIKLNRKNGWVIESRITNTIKGTSLTFQNRPTPDGKTIPWEIKGEIIITEK